MSPQPKLTLVDGCCVRGAARQQVSDFLDENPQAFAASQARYNDEEPFRGPLEPDLPVPRVPRHRGLAFGILVWFACWLVISIAVIFFAWVLPAIRGGQ